MVPTRVSLPSFSAFSVHSLKSSDRSCQRVGVSRSINLAIILFVLQLPSTSTRPGMELGDVFTADDMHSSGVWVHLFS